MLNNKGFAISSVLYLLLVAFLMFLMLMLAQFTSSTSVIGKANDDLINGSKFEVMQMKPTSSCVKFGNSKQLDEKYWYENNGYILRIKSRYGTMYWPKDFGVTETNGVLSGIYSDNKKISVKCLNKYGNLLNGDGSCIDVNLNQLISELSDDARFNYLIKINRENERRVAPTNDDEITIENSTYDIIKNKINEINEYEEDPLNAEKPNNSDACFTDINNFWYYGDYSACYENYDKYYNDIDLENIYYDFLNELKNNLASNNSLDLSWAVASYDLTDDGYLRIANMLYYKPVIYILDVSYNSEDFSFDKVIYFDMVYDEEKNKTENTFIDRENLKKLNITDKINQIIFYDTGERQIVKSPVLVNEFNNAKKETNEEYNNAYMILEVSDVLKPTDKKTIGLYDICE